LDLNHFLSSLFKILLELQLQTPKLQTYVLSPYIYSSYLLLIKCQPTHLVLILGSITRFPAHYLKFMHEDTHYSLQPFIFISNVIIFPSTC